MREINTNYPFYNHYSRNLLLQCKSYYFPSHLRFASVDSTSIEMGINTSKSPRTSPKATGQTMERMAGPRFAPLYHSYVGYIGFAWQFIYALIAFTMLCGYFQDHSTPVLIAFECITIVVYIILLLLARRFSRVKSSEIPNPDDAVENLLAFRNDQWHFTGVLFAHCFLLFFLAIFVITSERTANPMPDLNSLPAIYDDILVSQFVIIKFFHISVIGIAAVAIGVIMLETHASYLFDLTSGSSSAGQSEPLTGVSTDKSTVVNNNAGTNSIYNRAYM